MESWVNGAPFDRISLHSGSLSLASHTSEENSKEHIRTKIFTYLMVEETSQERLHMGQIQSSLKIIVVPRKSLIYILS